MAPKIGFIGIIGEMWAADPRGTMEWIADLGFDGMEGAASLSKPMGITVPEVKSYLQSIGLSAAAQGGSNIGATIDEQREGIRQAKEVGSHYYVDYYAPCKDRENILTYCEYFNRVGRMCADEGITFLYHNHNHEFKKIDNDYALDIIMANTDPDLVSIELDIGWVTFGGADPVSIIEKYADRCPVLHMKDFDHVPPENPAADEYRKTAVFAEVGDGIAPTKEVVDAALRHDIDWLVVEQDRMNTLGPKESLERSFRNLKEML